ncbi:iron ABC transporter permease [Paenibacillus validus]|uniref:FecCD family ABC transporter permease n=1 Tax=Paenibacillus validus TaxID=44253 RepID=UPI001FD2DB2B|nr:iron ABC transporter permease [Paenibacillus validus]MED4600642.1 iron ABC transporter permease [Paenibacillus validus]MED4605281.1 iron ABC transporter permease [Paenibacillus validus]
MATNQFGQIKAPAGRGARTGLMFSVGIICVLLALALSLVYGTKNLTLATVWEALFHYEAGNTTHQIVGEIRLPRALAAILIGAYFAISGAIMQAMTRNPLAEPSLLGVSYGAAFALVITMTLFPSVSALGATAASMIGAGLAAFFVFTITSVSKGGITPVKLALAGVAIGMFLSSLTSVVALHFNVSKEMSFWYAGGLANTDWKAVRMLAAAGAIGIPLALLLARSLTLFNLGVEVTKGLGIHVMLVKILGVFAVLLLTGSSVAVAGAVGFVGLVVPHISRMLVGPDYRFLLPVSAVLGSFLLVLADVGARMISPPYETPVGVVTAAMGVPFFLYLVRREGGRFS